MAQDAIALLEADHQRVEGLFREFKSPQATPRPSSTWRKSSAWN